VNTIEQPVPDLASESAKDQVKDQASSPEVEESSLLDDPSLVDPDFAASRINGFDGGTRPIFKEPSLYLSIAIVLVATSVCFSKTPIVFCLSLVVMTALAIVFHIVAERFLFRANKEHQIFAAPLEGVFVITLGAILPGLSLLAYGVFALSTVKQPNFGEELAKMALLLVVPFFNFVVWSAVRKRYLVRPRLIGLMNGFALGLSAAWSAIWVTSVFFLHTNPACKFGWMLLLCTAPFLLFASFCLGLDLWHKTEANIRRVTTTFSVLGVLLSFLFVFTPMARALFVQARVNDVRVAPLEEQGKAISALRAVATDEDLRPSKYPLGGFALAELLIPSRGLDSGTESDKELYFKVSGKSYFDSEPKAKKTQELGQEPINVLVGAKIPGLSLAKSQILGNLDAAMLSSSFDWTLTFHNSSASPQEARCEIAIPKQAVVSRVTLWVDGEPREGVFASTAKVQQAYQAVSENQRDELLVTMSAPDRLLVQCFPVPASGGESKIRIGFKLPLETTDGKVCSMKLPQMLASNFIQTKRHRVNIASLVAPKPTVSGLALKKKAAGYSLEGIVKNPDLISGAATLVVQRSTPFTETATLDWYSRKPRFIVERLKEIVTPAPKRLFVLIDSSASLKDYAAQIKETVANIPDRLKPIISFAGKPTQIIINAEAFEGGQDNWTALREAIETAAEQPNSAVLWIHGPQPVEPKLAESSVLDLVHRVCLYDLQIESGSNSLLSALRMEDASGLITYETVGTETSARSLKALLPIWDKGTKNTNQLAIERTIALDKPHCPVVDDRQVSAQVSALWAKDEVTRLLASGQQHEAQVLASNYRLVTPATGALVLDYAKDYKNNRLNPGASNDSVGHPAAFVGGLVGAPVDPRYGQSNEVGQLADYGYDAARDIARLLTAIALLISIVVAIVFVRGRKVRTWSVYAKAAGIVFLAPMVVHLIGTFMINSCGGLGGGL